MRLIILIRSLFVFFIISIYIALFPRMWIVSAEKPVLAHHAMSLDNRYGNSFVNSIFKDNILLTLAYMTGSVRNKSEINWDEINKPSQYIIGLQPGEVFAFHDNILNQYKNKQIATTNAHFSANEGFLSDGYLYGDGVCHLASLINWAALDAGLSVSAPTRHDFAAIPDIPSIYGVSIYSSSFTQESNQKQNLYIENNYDYPITFVFEYKNDMLSLKISK